MKGESSEDQGLVPSGVGLEPWSQRVAPSQPASLCSKAHGWSLPNMWTGLKSKCSQAKQ